jgi:hypothetical protein
MFLVESIEKTLGNGTFFQSQNKTLPKSTAENSINFSGRKTKTLILYTFSFFLIMRWNK